MKKIRTFYGFSLNEVISDIVEVKDKELKEYRKFINSKIKEYEKMIVLREVDNFIKERNAEIKANSNLKNKSGNFKRKEYKIEFNSNEIFAFTEDMDFTEQFVLFNGKIPAFIEMADVYYEIGQNDFISFNNFIEKNVRIKIDECFKDNPYYLKVKPLSIMTNYDISIKGKYTYSAYIYYKEKKYPLFSTDNYSKDYSPSKKNEILMDIQSKANVLIMDLQRIDEKLVDGITSKLKILTKATYIFTHDFSLNQEPYHFATKVLRVYVNYKFLQLSKEDIEIFVKKTNTYTEIYNALQKIHYSVPVPFKFVDKIENGKLYSIEDKLISFDLSLYSKEYSELQKTITENIQAVIAFDKFDVIPTTNVRILRRYYVTKDKEFELNNDNYVIYRFKGNENRTYSRGYKNGLRLSHNQLTKLFRKINKK
jgi:hypothetical protein